MKSFSLTLLIVSLKCSRLPGAIIFQELPVQPPGPPALPVMLDLDGDASIDLGFRTRDFGGTNRLFEVLISTRAAVIRIDGPGSAFGSNGTALGEGFRVDSLEDQPLYSYFENSGGGANEMIVLSVGALNSFSNEGTGDFFETSAYLGFRFEGDEGNHYGYAKIDGRRIWDFAVLSYAFESEPDTPILTGAIPEPSTALLLTLFSALALRQRRRRWQKLSLPRLPLPH